MSIAMSDRPGLRFVLVELAALPVVVLLLVAAAVSLIVGDGAILEWTAVAIALLDGVVVGTFLIGGRPLRPLAETNLLAQILNPLGRFLAGAMGMVASGFLGAIIALYVAADAAGSGYPGWTSKVLGVVLASAVVLGTLGSAALLCRRVMSLKVRARVKSLRRGVRRLGRAMGTPAIELNDRSIVLHHLATRWYLLWLPLLCLVVAAIWLLATVK